MNNDLFISLVLAHVIGDFYLQTDGFCIHKENKKLKSWFLYAHTIAIGLLSWLMVPSWGFGLWALIIAVSHFVIDVIKLYCPKGLWSFIIDQILHIIILGVISSAVLEFPYLLLYQGYSVMPFILAILLSIKPANILIKLVLKNYRLGESESCNDIESAGALIGNLERILTIVFVMIGQYQAIGFIIAAKSILRFKDTDTAKTEYVLAGTFLSFGIAILCGLFAVEFGWGFSVK